METTYSFDIDSGPNCPVSGFRLSADLQYLYKVEFVLKECVETVFNTDPNDVQQLAKEQILAYLDGKLREFDLPIKLRGTVFQLQVWSVINEIPFGQVLTYLQVARKVGADNLVRAVGQAANRNPIPVIVPCHRVVGSGGKMTGFASGIATKTFLLGLEKGDMLW